MTKLRRFKLCLHMWLVALDQLAFVTLASPKYILFDGQPPSPQETISSKTGRMADKGKGWALLLEAIIDKLFMLLGDEPYHCQRAIVSEDDWKNYRN